MSRSLGSLLLLLLIASLGIAQPRFNRLYNMGQLLPPYPSSFCFGLLTDTAQFIITGDNYSPTRTAYVAGFDYNGGKLWQKDLHFAGPYNIVPGPSAQTRISAGTNVLVGCELDNFINPKIVIEQPFLYFFDNHGDSLRYIKFTDSLEPRRVLSIARTTDQHLIGAGITYYTTATFHSRENQWISDSTGIYVAQYDTLGNLLWEKRLSGALSEFNGYTYAKKVIPAENGNFIIAGFAKNPVLGATGNYSHFIMKMDSTGGVLWSRNYRYNPYDEWDEIDIAPARDGGFYFLTGRSTIPNQPGNGTVLNDVLYYGHCTTAGDTLWTRTFARPGGAGNYEWTTGTIIEQDQEGNLLMGGWVYDSWQRPTLVIADSNGRVKSFRQYQYKTDGRISHTLYSIRRTPYNQLLMGGTVTNIIPAAWDSLGAYSWLIQTDSAGCLEDGCALADTAWQQPGLSIPHMGTRSTIRVFPNPTENILHIQGLGGRGASIELWDMQGKMINTWQLMPQQETINTTSIPQGIYLLLIRMEDGWQEAVKFSKR